MSLRYWQQIETGLAKFLENYRSLKNEIEMTKRLREDLKHSLDVPGTPSSIGDDFRAAEIKIFLLEKDLSAMRRAAALTGVQID